MLKFMFITNQPDIAAFVHAHGVDCLFVDLEILGKQKRQGHLNAVISNHSIEDIAPLRQAVPKAELLVRINPINPRTAQEVNAVIKAGADFIMLPMFTSALEVLALTHIIDGRVPLIPLVETPGAVDALAEVIALPGVSEIYIGLNDLSLALKYRFMFQPLANGMLEKMAATLRAKNMPFGFGGLARLGQGALGAEQVMSEHLRLGSSRVILSRAFHGGARNLQELHAHIDFAVEIQRLRDVEAGLAKRDVEQIKADYQRLVETVNTIVAG